MVLQLMDAALVHCKVTNLFSRMFVFYSFGSEKNYIG